MEELFLSLGYTKEDYKNIRSHYAIRELTDETLINHVNDIYNYLIEYGYSKNDVVRITKKSPFIYGCTLDNIKNKIEELSKFNYSKNDIIKMSKSFPSIYGLSNTNINNKISDLVKLGYTKNDVIIMTKKLPAIYGYTIDNIKNRIKYLCDLGYNYNDVIRMTTLYPNIFSSSLNKINQIIEDFCELGYTMNDFIFMSISFPQIFGLSIDTIKRKVTFYNSIGIHELPILKPKNIMISVDLCYARYMYLKSIGVEINIDKCTNLFRGNSDFKKRFGITKEELLMLYNYEKDMEVNNGRII